MIAKVIRKGYKINSKVLRPAQVAVERQQIDQKTEEKAEEGKNTQMYTNENNTNESEYTKLEH